MLVISFDIFTSASDAYISLFCFTLRTELESNNFQNYHVVSTTKDTEASNPFNTTNVWKVINFEPPNVSTKKKL